MRDGIYQSVLDALGDGQAHPNAIGERLRDLSERSDDRDLRIFLGKVADLLGSPLLKDLGEGARIRLPYERAPFKPLIDYCQRQLDRQE
jgi:hypothetical protein